jgi:hypothetical protein
VATDQPVVKSVAAWLSEQFPSATIEHQGDFDRETHLFRVVRRQGGHPELEISREVLEREEPAQVIEELRREDVASRLDRDPNFRIQFFQDGLRGLETRIVHCDGRRYRVVRDAQHNVSIYDSEDRRLEKMPQSMLVLPDSVFKRDAAKWCSDIRSWRGPTQ